MIARIIIGSIVALIGAAMVMKSEWILDNFGRSQWAEEHLGGGSRLLYKLIGLAIIFIGFSIITNLIGNMLEWFAGLFISG